MLLSLTNDPRDYAWGSTTALAALQGRAPSGTPEAEVWLGAHPSSPAIVEGGQGLDAWLAERGESLPYLLKLLAADAPLSLQAHPSPEQATSGFARENALGIPLDAPERNYRDDGHKPEIIVALSERFEALCGFRPLEATLRLLRGLEGPSESSTRAVSELLAQLAPVERTAESGADADAAALRRAVGWLLAEADAATIAGLEAAILSSTSREFGQELRNVQALAGGYPGDPGVVVALLLNFVVLSAGEALYLPAGNLHAYMSGLGVELMAASDNVLRGGLTPKHIDVAELLRVLDTHPLAKPHLHPLAGDHASIEVFAPGVADFEMLRVRAGEEPVAVALRGISIAVATAGELRIDGSSGTASLRAGESLLITADEREVRVSGPGELFIAQPGG